MATPRISAPHRLYLLPMYNYVSVSAAAAGAPSAVRDGTIKLHDAAGFAGMRKAGRLAAEILHALVPFVKPGVTTDEIDALVLDMSLGGGGSPATLRICGYTLSCCTSINLVRRLGIPTHKTPA